LRANLPGNVTGFFSVPPAVLAKPAAARPASAISLVRLALSFNLARFLAVGCAGLALDAGLFSALVFEGVPESLARAASLGAATLLTWRLNRRFTFGDSRRLQPFEGGWYVAVALGAQGLSYLIFLTLRTLMPDLPALAALLIGAVAATAFSYSGQRFLTFRGRVRR
jgi:putative flippase GtrA